MYTSIFDQLLLHKCTIRNCLTEPEKCFETEEGIAIVPFCGHILKLDCIPFQYKYRELNNYFFIDSTEHVNAMDIESHPDSLQQHIWPCRGPIFISMFIGAVC